MGSGERRSDPPLKRERRRHPRTWRSSPPCAYAATSTPPADPAAAPVKARTGDGAPGRTGNGAPGRTGDGLNLFLEIRLTPEILFQGEWHGFDRVGERTRAE